MNIWPDRPIEMTEVPGAPCDVDGFAFESGAGLGRIELTPDLTHEPSGIESVSKWVGIGETGVLDCTVIRLTSAGTAAAVFTRSRCPSDSVLAGRDTVADGRVRLLCVLSKNANVFAPTGARDIEQLTAALASEFDVAHDEILISCTGVIGVSLPMDRILEGLADSSAELIKGGLDRSAEAILTTDRGPKKASVRMGDIVLCGFCKGAGMIEPNMATMLAYLFTNARMDRAELDAILRRCVERTFNAISVDSDTSTSDTVAILSTGETELPDEHAADFENAVLMLCAKLARDVVGQGEGVEKLIEVEVGVETSIEDARALARSLVNSPLIKTAVHGADPNWGRVVMAIGKPAASLSFDRIVPSSLCIRLMGATVFDRGETLEVDLEGLSKTMQAAKTASISVEIGVPRYQFKVWGCDLTNEYIRINAEYTT